MRLPQQDGRPPPHPPDGRVAAAAGGSFRLANIDHAATLPTLKRHSLIPPPTPPQRKPTSETLLPSLGESRKAWTSQQQVLKFSQTGPSSPTAERAESPAQSPLNHDRVVLTRNTMCETGALSTLLRNAAAVADAKLVSQQRLEALQPNSQFRDPHAASSLLPQLPPPSAVPSDGGLLPEALPQTHRPKRRRLDPQPHARGSQREQAPAPQPATQRRPSGCLPEPEQDAGMAGDATGAHLNLCVHDGAARCIEDHRRQSMHVGAVSTQLAMLMCLRDAAGVEVGSPGSHRDDPPFAQALSGLVPTVLEPAALETPQPSPRRTRHSRASSLRGRRAVTVDLTVCRVHPWSGRCRRFVIELRQARPDRNTVAQLIESAAAQFVVPPARMLCLATRCPKPSRTECGSRKVFDGPARALLPADTLQAAGVVGGMTLVFYDAASLLPSVAAVMCTAVATMTWVARSPVDSNSIITVALAAACVSDLAHGSVRSRAVSKVSVDLIMMAGVCSAGAAEEVALVRIARDAEVRADALAAAISGVAVIVTEVTEIEMAEQVAWMLATRQEEERVRAQAAEACAAEHDDVGGDQAQQVGAAGEVTLTVGTADDRGSNGGSNGGSDGDGDGDDGDSRQPDSPPHIISIITEGDDLAPSPLSPKKAADAPSLTAAQASPTSNTTLLGSWATFNSTVPSPVARPGKSRKGRRLKSRKGLHRVASSTGRNGPLMAFHQDSRRSDIGELFIAMAAAAQEPPFEFSSDSAYQEWVKGRVQKGNHAVIVAVERYPMLGSIDPVTHVCDDAARLRATFESQGWSVDVCADNAQEPWLRPERQNIVHLVWLMQRMQQPSDTAILVWQGRGALQKPPPEAVQQLEDEDALSQPDAPLAVAQPRPVHIMLCSDSRESETLEGGGLDVLLTLDTLLLIGQRARGRVIHYVDCWPMGGTPEPGFAALGTTVGWAMVPGAHEAMAAATRPGKKKGKAAHRPDPPQCPPLPNVACAVYSKSQHGGLLTYFFNKAFGTNTVLADQDVTPSKLARYCARRLQANKAEEVPLELLQDRRGSLGAEPRRVNSPMGAALDPASPAEAGEDPDTDSAARPVTEEVVLRYAGPPKVPGIGSDQVVWFSMCVTFVAPELGHQSRDELWRALQPFVNPLLYKAPRRRHRRQSIARRQSIGPVAARQDPMSPGAAIGGGAMQRGFDPSKLRKLYICSFSYPGGNRLKRMLYIRGSERDLQKLDKARRTGALDRVMLIHSIERSPYASPVHQAANRIQAAFRGLMVFRQIASQRHVLEAWYRGRVALEGEYEEACEEIRAEIRKDSIFLVQVSENGRRYEVSKWCADSYTRLHNLRRTDMRRIESVFRWRCDRQEVYEVFNLGSVGAALNISVSEAKARYGLRNSWLLHRRQTFARYQIAGEEYAGRLQMRNLARAVPELPVAAQMPPRPLRPMLNSDADQDRKEVPAVVIPAELWSAHVQMPAWYIGGDTQPADEDATQLRTVTSLAELWAGGRNLPRAAQVLGVASRVASVRQRAQGTLGPRSAMQKLVSGVRGRAAAPAPSPDAAAAPSGARRSMGALRQLVNSAPGRTMLQRRRSRASVTSAASVTTVVVEDR